MLVVMIGGSDSPQIKEIKPSTLDTVARPHLGNCFHFSGFCYGSSWPLRDTPLARIDGSRPFPRMRLSLLRLLSKVRSEYRFV